ncbi:hypothetical protein V6N13_135964 [Hibiscus sabdariffa]
MVWQLIIKGEPVPPYAEPFEPQDEPPFAPQTEPIVAAQAEPFEPEDEPPFLPQTDSSDTEYLGSTSESESSFEDSNYSVKDTEEVVQPLFIDTSCRNQFRTHFEEERDASEIRVESDNEIESSDSFLIQMVVLGRKDFQNLMLRLTWRIMS